MKIQHPLLVRAVGSTGALFVRHLGRTLNYHFRYKDPTVAPEVARQTGQRFIYAFFHEVMLFPAYYWNWPEMHILISEHRDGELITQVIRRLGFTRDPRLDHAGRRACAARDELRIDQGHLCVTPDGPRGPRRSVHQGIAYLGSRTGLPIVGAGMAFKRPWRARSWDRFAVPRPYSAAACVVPEPVTVPIDADRDTIEIVPPRSRAAHAGRHARGRSLGRRTLTGPAAMRRRGICSPIRSSERNCSCGVSAFE